jgi:hypothetical protein
LIAVQIVVTLVLIDVLATRRALDFTTVHATLTTRSS